MFTPLYLSIGRYWASWMSSVSEKDPSEFSALFDCQPNVPEPGCDSQQQPDQCQPGSGLKSTVQKDTGKQSDKNRQCHLKAEAAEIGKLPQPASGFSLHGKILISRTCRLCFPFKGSRLTQAMLQVNGKPRLVFPTSSLKIRIRCRSVRYRKPVRPCRREGNDPRRLRV